MSRILPITIVSPGRRGLNKERSNDLLGAEWVTDALNCVLSREGRVAARRGWIEQTTDPISGGDQIAVLFEYLKDDGTAELISVADKKIYTGITDYTDGNADITPTTTPSGDDWQFVNFNDKAIGFQQGHTPIVYDGSGAFADLSASSGTLPKGNAACAAFGRLWAFDESGQVLQYSALLDEEKWGSADGGGAIDLANVWTRGVDSGVAVAAFGANLVVFGRNHIIIYADDSGSELGVNPDQLYVVDTIEGVGTIARDSVQAIGEGDLGFLSRHGIQLLGRVIREKSNPATTISKNIRTYLANLLTVQPTSAIRSAYSPELGYYMLLLPSAGRIILADMRFPFEDDDGNFVVPMLEWDYTNMPTSLLVRNSGDLLFGFDGRVGQYGGNLDDEDPYRVTITLPWLALDPEVVGYLKILKEIPTIVQLSASATLAWTWEFDFNGEQFSGTTNYVLEGIASEWGEAEYSVNEYSGGLTLQARVIEGAGEGQFFRVGTNVQINGFDFVLQQIKLLFKLGRLTA